jgi:co-chaperonin GroES (HSP10)
MRSIKKIIVTLEKNYIDELDFNGGKIYFDSSYQPEWNAQPYGIVHSVPEVNPVMYEGFIYNVQVGDKLYFHYGVVTDNDNLLEHEGKDYRLVDYFNAIATVRDGVIHPCGDYVIIEPIDAEHTSEFLIIPEIAKKKLSTKGRVHASNHAEAPVGSIVEFDEIGMFENKIEGKKYYTMSINDLIYIHETV